MISYICDWCGKKVRPEDLMPLGGGSSYSGGLGMHITAERRGGGTVTVAVGPVGVDGHWNAHQWHRACVQEIVQQGTLAERGAIGGAS